MYELGTEPRFSARMTSFLNFRVIFSDPRDVLKKFIKVSKLRSAPWLLVLRVSNSVEKADYSDADECI